MDNSGNAYEGDTFKHSGARSYIPAEKFRKAYCNNVYDVDGTPNGKECPYGTRCTFRHPPDESRSKTKDCRHVKPDGAGCRHGESCIFRHPEDPGFGETESEPAKKTSAGKAPKVHAVSGKAAGHPKKHPGPQFEMPRGVTYSDMLKSLADVVDNHPVVAVVLDKRADILKQIEELLLTTKKVDAICQKATGK